MGIDDSTYELIDQYLQGKLPEDHPFVQRLKEDDALAQEVELQRLTNIAILNRRLMDVEKLLDSQRSKFVRQNSTTWKWVLGATALLLVGTSAYFYNASTTQEAQISSTKPTVEKSVLPENRLQEKPITTPTKTESTKIETIIKNEEVEVRKGNDISKNIVAENNENVPSYLSENKPSADIHKTETKTESAPVNSHISPKNPCADIHLKAFIEENRPCKGASDGYLTIKNPRGGKAPYHYSLDNKPFQESSLFEGLASNDYNIVLKDANGCIEIVHEKYTLKSKNCSKYSEHIFNPNVTSWEVPNNQEKQGELSILDENGNLVYHKMLEKFEKINWNGSRNGGELLIPGVYIYNIKYSDGVVDQGNITITY